MNRDEMLRLQGFQPRQFRTVVSPSEVGKQCGNAMSVNVLERVLVNLLPAAGLAITYPRVQTGCYTRVLIHDGVALLHGENAPSDDGQFRANCDAEAAGLVNGPLPDRWAQPQDVLESLLGTSEPVPWVANRRLKCGLPA